MKETFTIEQVTQLTHVESYNNRIKRGYRPTLETFDGNHLLENLC